MSVSTDVNNNTNVQMSLSDSFFDGGVLGHIGVNLLLIFLFVLTLGICLPWALCIREKWTAEHTVIGGSRLTFTGTALGLFGTWIKIFLLTLITLGIYSFWASITIKKWVVKHTVFQ